MVYRLTLSYNGSGYAGWQRQPNAVTVQQATEEALGVVFGSEIRIHAAGRTDAGVHARGQTAHLQLPRPFPVKGLLHATNHHLCPDIRILAVHRMPEGFHARKSTHGKEYLYRIVRGRAVSPLDAPFVAMESRPLDVLAMRQAMAAIPGRHDFSAFALSGGSHGQPWRRVFAATLDEQDAELRLRFVGEGFLRGMVRSLAGTLIEIGRGERSAADMVRLLEPGHVRGDAGFTALAKGLCLEQVFYPPAWQPFEGYP